jgi:hypothetical protein
MISVFFRKVEYLIWELQTEERFNFYNAEKLKKLQYQIEKELVTRLQDKL